MPKQNGFEFTRHVRMMKCACGYTMVREGVSHHNMGEFDRYVCRQCFGCRMVLTKLKPQPLFMRAGQSISEARKNARVDRESVAKFKAGVTPEELDGAA